MQNEDLDETEKSLFEKCTNDAWNNLLAKYAQELKKIKAKPVDLDTLIQQSLQILGQDESTSLACAASVTASFQNSIENSHSNRSNNFADGSPPAQQQMIVKNAESMDEESDDFQFSDEETRLNAPMMSYTLDFEGNSMKVIEKTTQKRVQDQYIVEREKQRRVDDSEEMQFEKLISPCISEFRAECPGL